jgi:hypothetical protein
MRSQVARGAEWADVAMHLCYRTASLSKACRKLGLALEPIEARLMTDTTAALREALGSSFNDAWATGANMDLAATVDLAVKKLGG